ncbi:hypothetical protein BLL42_02190 [Pseudomonas frederiksbergensis]|uniref:Uncharacterized protein n=1 Tax=Pseudomonas frederiksbergensis TaxID=104087 RepID=A0A1J0EFC9_9PSED|nr:hypothetical protein [Pseudomonas frederiksbergensis]APC14600.1 hypothetical protein BLL42_02190 [Pseudomonas frederiksbergensis]
MKVTDAEILKAIWQAQVKKTAKGVITNYVGGSKGLKSDREQDRHYAQYQSMISRGGLGIPLSKGQLARRLKALIGGDNLQWRGHPGNAYEFCTDAAMDVFRFARNWWEERGVPAGFDQVKKCMRTIQLSDYESLAAQLEQELLERFGNLEVTA